ncbi:MAG TPA: EAL domain-containing protein [Caldimonas sp.]|nr:EAL domain-containing protein [Caldimonas sp.]
MGASSTWWLERIAADGTPLAVPLRPLPFRIGRDDDNELVVVAPGVSRRHARLDLRDDTLVLTDLRSTNGTWVNRARLEGPRALAVHDIVHIGDAEFRVRRADMPLDTDPQHAAPERTVVAPAGAMLSEHFVANETAFRAFIAGDGMAAALQPILTVEGQLFAWEALGRCTNPALPPSPMQLFRLAARLHREAELSAAFRSHAVQSVMARRAQATVFANVHPVETFAPSFVDGIARLVCAYPGLRLVVEIHEAAVVDTTRMKELAARLAELNVRFAYDDFGAGQARLVELGEVPPHFVKFDMALVHGLHQAAPRKQRLVADLVRLVDDLGSVPLAEGIEDDADGAVCRDMGFRLFQGYLIGRPTPVDALTSRF